MAACRPAETPVLEAFLPKRSACEAPVTPWSGFRKRIFVLEIAEQLYQARRHITSLLHFQRAASGAGPVSANDEGKRKGDRHTTK